MHAARAEVVRLDRNAGPAAARNAGLARVRTPYVAFVDSDVEPVPGWLGLLRRHLDDPAVALVAPRVLGREERVGDSWLERYEQARSSLDLGADPAVVRVHGPVSYVPGACLLGRVDALGEGSTRPCGPARTSTSCGGWAATGGRSGTRRRRACGTTTAPDRRSG